MAYPFKLPMLVFLLALVACKQEITVEENSFTGINSRSITDVIYKSAKDTVLISRYDGKILEHIKGFSSRRVIAEVGDEIYSLAYNPKEAQIYAATLNSGVLVINEKNGEVIKALQIEDTWAHDILFNASCNLLSAYDFKDNAYIWKTDEQFEPLKLPEDVKALKPRHISNECEIYFDGLSKVYLWKIGKDKIWDSLPAKGILSDVDSEGNLLMLQDKSFGLFSSQHDSLSFSKHHPDWPIFVASRDTTVRISLQLSLTGGLVTKNYIYTTSIDKTIRKWRKSDGALVGEMLNHRGTISSMDISEDGSQLVSGDLKGAVEFWNLK